MVTVVLLGTLDTRDAECALVRDRVPVSGCQAIVVDGDAMRASPPAGHAGGRLNAMADRLDARYRPRAVAPVAVGGPA